MIAAVQHFAEAYRARFLLVSIAVAASVAAAQWAIFSWVQVRIDGDSPIDIHGLTAGAFDHCLPSASCVHVTNGAALILVSALAAWAASRNNGVLAPFIAGIGLATSSFAIALMVNPIGAEALISVALFLVMASDAAKAIRLPTSAQILLVVATVIQDPVYVLSALTYSACVQTERNNTTSRLGLAGAALAALAVSLSAHHGFFNLLTQAPVSAVGSPLTMIAIAFILFIVAPALVCVMRTGLLNRIGFSWEGSAYFLLGLTALLQALINSTNSPAGYWICAEVAFMIGALRSAPLPTIGGKVLLVTTALLVAVQVALLPKHDALLNIAGVPKGTASLSEALANANIPRNGVCFANSEADVRSRRTVPTIYGRIEMVSAPGECLSGVPDSSIILTGGSSGITDWGDGGKALLKASFAHRAARERLRTDTGSVSPVPQGAKGAFSTVVATPDGSEPAFIVQAGYTYTFRCAWRGVKKKISFASGNPLQAYTGATAVRLTVYARNNGKDRVLLDEVVSPHGGPVSWSYHSIQLPEAAGRCGDLVFTARPLSNSSIATWGAFVAPAFY